MKPFTLAVHFYLHENHSFFRIISLSSFSCIWKTHSIIQFMQISKAFLNGSNTKELKSFKTLPTKNQHTNPAATAVSASHCPICNLLLSLVYLRGLNPVLLMLLQLSSFLPPIRSRSCFVSNISEKRRFGIIIIIVIR